MIISDAAFAVLVLLIAWSFYRAQKDSNFAAFNAFDLIMENGRLSRLACIFIASFGVSSWVIIRLTLDGKMTEGLFTAYCLAWVAPIIAKLFSPPQVTSSTSTTSVSTTTVPVQNTITAPSVTVTPTEV